MRNKIQNFKFILIMLLLFSLIQVQARSFESKEFSISGPSHYIQKTASKIYKKGGNVVDIAVAAALTLSVTTPYYVSLGAGGFALIDMGQGVKALDFREMASQQMHENYYKNKSSVVGGSAVGVPGFVAGLWELHKKYGSLPWKKLFKEPLNLAKKGYHVSGEWVEITKSVKKWNFGMTKFLNKGRFFKPGEKIKQKNLVQALALIQEKNIDGFYKGKVAQDIVNSVKKTGGDMDLEDLKTYKVRWLKPIKKFFNGYFVYIMPPPSSGGIVISSALDLIKQKKLSKYKPLSLNELHLFSEIFARSFRSRIFVADPDFYQIPFDKILSSHYLKKMGSSISEEKVVELEPMKETTHLIVMDKKGNTVSMTLTLNLGYGSKVVTSKYGIVLNNQMDDFSTKLNQPNSYDLIQGKGNTVQARKRPLSSMSPTIVKLKKRVVLALGGSGGPRIISGVLQTLYRTLVNGFDVDRSIQFPRIHHQFLPRKTYIEKDRISPEILESLIKKGHNIEEVKSLGKVYGIYRDKAGIIKSAYDHRGDGIAWGL